MKPAVAIIGATLLVVLGALIFYLRDMTAPAITISPVSGTISSKLPLVMTVRDTGSGLKSLTVETVQGGKTLGVLSRKYPAGVYQARETIGLGQIAGLKDGTFRLNIDATDRAVSNFGAGNSKVLSLPFDYQNKPPAVVILSTAHNVARGGAGLVVYSLNREVEKTGVIFADRFYPAYRQPEGFYACLFPCPYNVSAESFVPRVIAVDMAGNERQVGIYYRLLHKTFPKDRITLNDHFLEKISADFKDKFPQAGSKLEVFLKANRDLREHDRKLLLECGRKT